MLKIKDGRLRIETDEHLNQGSKIHNSDLS